MERAIGRQDSLSLHALWEIFATGKTLHIEEADTDVTIIVLKYTLLLCIFAYALIGGKRTLPRRWLWQKRWPTMPKLPFAMLFGCA